MKETGRKDEGGPIKKMVAKICKGDKKKWGRLVSVRQGLAIYKGAYPLYEPSSPFLSFLSFFPTHHTFFFSFLAFLPCIKDGS